MTITDLADVLRGAGIDLNHRELDDDPVWDEEPTRTFRFRLDYAHFSNLITMHRVTTALLAAGCVNAQVVERECGSEDEVSHWRELVMEFPRKDR